MRHRVLDGIERGFHLVLCETWVTDNNAKYVEKGLYRISNLCICLASDL